MFENYSEWHVLVWIVRIKMNSGLVVKKNIHGNRFPLLLFFQNESILRIQNSKLQVPILECIKLNRAHLLTLASLLTCYCSLLMCYHSLLTTPYSSLSCLSFPQRRIPRWNLQSLSLKVMPKIKWLDLNLGVHFMALIIWNSIFSWSLKSLYIWGDHQYFCEQSSIECNFIIF